MRITVEAYSGRKANERPRSFTIGSKVINVLATLDRWYGEDHEYFKVKADDGCIYVLRYNMGEDAWELVMMEKGD